jgi:hypothetical protein
MKYTVVWNRRATNDLAQLWMDAENRSDIAAASNAIDEQLSRDPFLEKCEVVNRIGALIMKPLGVDYWISEGNRVVTVYAVWTVSEE